MLRKRRFNRKNDKMHASANEDFRRILKKFLKNGLTAVSQVLYLVQAVREKRSADIYLLERESDSIKRERDPQEGNAEPEMLKSNLKYSKNLLGSYSYSNLLGRYGTVSPVG